MRAFLEMEAEDKVSRTEASVKAVLSEIQFRAGGYLSVPSEADVGAARGNKWIVLNKITAGRLIKRVVACPFRVVRFRSWPRQ